MDSIIVATSESTLDIAIQRHLSRKGYRAKIANNHAELDELVDRLMPKLIVIEPLLCSGPGWRRTQERIKSKHAAVMLVTAMPCHLALRYSMRFGAIALLNKPCVLNELYNALDFVVCGYSVFPDGVLTRNA